MEERYTPPPPYPLLRPFCAPGVHCPPLLRVATTTDLEWFVAYVVSLEAPNPTPPPSWARASNATPRPSRLNKVPMGPSSHCSHTTETQCVSGSNPGILNIPPVEIIDISDSEEDILLAPPFQCLDPNKGKGKGKARETSIEVTESSDRQEESAVPLPILSYTPVIGSEDYEMDVDTPTPPNLAAQASTSNLDDLRQPAVSCPPLPSQMAFLGVLLKDFKDKTSFNKGYDLDLEANGYVGQLDMDEEVENRDGATSVQ
ncbi:hypothetical protein C8J57DRAFT_1235162 [Mycena rebaudengoi]|nr:hypothetical protein C8J57DRAFT_1235162 [Mycena rebaudengoi]